MSRGGRVLLEPAWILHRRPYRDTSELVDVFSRGHGRIAAVARGSRGRRRRVPMEPFQPLRVSWAGRGDLVTLTGVEPCGPGLAATGRRLLSMFYVNELLLRLTGRQDPHPEIFALYENTLASLAGADEEAPTLRRFERDLLDALGYGLMLDRDSDGRAVDPEASYVYRLEEGPQRARRGERSSLLLSGGSLLAIRSGRYEGPEQLREARVLLTAALDHHLGGRPLKTRQVLNALRARAS